MDIHEVIKICSTLEHKIFIKYSLVEMPNQMEVNNWLNLTEKYINESMSEAEAGQLAADESFVIDKTILRRSQADTIEALLEMARKKVKEESNDD